MKGKKNEKWSQDLTNIKTISNGVIFCKDGRAIKILEVLPVNFYQKTPRQRNDITNDYMGFFKTCPGTVHLKMRTEKADVNALITNIRMAVAQEGGSLLQERANEAIQHIKALKNDNTICRKYYIMFEYEGDPDGKKSNKIESILYSMYETELQIRSRMSTAGNIVLSPIDPNMHAGEVLYKFYNPLTSEEETFGERILRINYDKEKYNNSVPADLKRFQYDDAYISPKGIDTRGRSWLLMDGQYHTFIAIRDNGYPEFGYTGWLDIVPQAIGIDIDIFCRRMSYDTVIGGLKQMSKWTRNAYRAKITNPEKAEELASEYQNSEYIRKTMQDSDEDLFETLVIITIRGNTFKEMNTRKNAVVKELKARSIYTTQSFNCAIEYFKTVAPDMYYSKYVFNKNKRNFLTRNLAQLYNYTSFELFNSNGYVLGKSAQNDSLLAIDNFDTSRYSNANMAIIGTPGSGKTFLEMMIAYRMRFMGIRTIFILPLKGHEYSMMCRKIGGEYIKLSPQGKTCVNIMQIRPQQGIDKSLLGDDVQIEDSPLLAKKIASLAVFLQMNMQGTMLTPQEKQRFNKVCTDLYRRYGITADNNSIWMINRDGQKVLRPMPILRDLNDALAQDAMLARYKDALIPYIDGVASNMNGQTNVNLSNRCLVFDVNKQDVGEDLLPAFMYIAFDCAYDLCKENLSRKDALFLDEVWQMMANPACAKQVKEAVKVIRGYGACTVLATQDLDDFLNSADGFGKSVLASTQLKFILRLTDEELYDVTETLHLSQTDYRSFRSFPAHGRGMFISGNDKIVVDFVAERHETMFFNTDVNKRGAYEKMLAEEEKEKGGRRPERGKPTKNRKKQMQKPQYPQGRRQMNRPQVPENQRRPAGRQGGHYNPEGAPRRTTAQSQPARIYRAAEDLSMREQEMQIPRETRSDSDPYTRRREQVAYETGGQPKKRV